MKKASEIKTSLLKELKSSILGYFEYSEKNIDCMKRLYNHQACILIDVGFSSKHAQEFNEFLHDFRFNADGLGKIDFLSFNQILCLKDQIKMFTDRDPLLIEIFKAINLI